MKKIYLLLLFSQFFTVASFAQQNLVPNGNFEDYTGCPTAFSQISNCKGWEFWNAGNSDYFNTCATGSCNVPNTARGYQLAHSGNGFVGGLSWVDTRNVVKEIFGREITPMQIGKIYEVSISVSLSNVSTVATNDVGIYFSDEAPKKYNVTYIDLIPVVPQVQWPNTIISDTQNWVRLTKIFVADSAYDNIAIGGFGKLPAMKTIPPNTTNAASYYFFDSVVVKEYDSIAITFDDTAFCAGDKYNIKYHVARKKQTGNTFTLQLSNATGSFSGAVNIGSIISDSSNSINVTIPANTPNGNGYKMRLITSNYADTSFESDTFQITNALISKPIATNNGALCEKDTLKLAATTTTMGVRYSWTGPNNFSSNLQYPTIEKPVPGNSGNYILTTFLGACNAKDTTVVIVNAGTGPTGTSATGTNIICENDTLLLFGMGNDNNFNWKGPQGFTSNIQNPIIAKTVQNMSGDYVLSVGRGNCISNDTVTITVKPVAKNFSAIYNSPICAGQPVNFSATSTSSGVSYTWTGPNSFVYSGAAPTIGVSQPIHSGNYYVTATLNGCALKDTVTVNVKPLPDKPIADGASPLCSGEILNLNSATTSTGVAYSWTGPDNFVSTDQNPAITNTTTAMSGSYIVTVTKDGCTSADTTTVLVKQQPVATTTSSNSPLCAGDNLLLSIGTSATGSSYTWHGPNNFTANTQNTAVTGAAPVATGWYVATVDLNGCSFKDSTYAVVNAIPAKPVLNYNSPLCISQALNLIANTVNTATYSWTGPNSFTSNTQNPVRNSMQNADTGKYSATVTVNGCTSPVSDITVKINPVPFVNIMVTPGDTICSGDNASYLAIPSNHGGTPLYQWYVNGIATGSSGIVYNSSGLSNGDIIRCEMTEYTKCHVSYTDQSNDIAMVVMPWLAPSVTFTVNPNRPLQMNEYVTFTATPKDAGLLPKYQWKRNGQNVLGATGAVWSANALNDNDNITVELASSYRCPQPAKATAAGVTIKVLTGVNNVPGMSGLTVYPNPNNGHFVLSAKTGNPDKLTLTIINAVGEIIYKELITPKDNYISHSFKLNNLYSGIYILNIQSIQGTNSMKFMVY